MQVKTKWGVLSEHYVEEDDGSKVKSQIHIEHDGRLFQVENYYLVHDVITAIRGVSVLDFTRTHLVLEVDHFRDLGKLSRTVTEAIKSKAAQQQKHPAQKTQEKGSDGRKKAPVERQSSRR